MQVLLPFLPIKISWPEIFEYILFLPLPLLDNSHDFVICSDPRNQNSVLEQEKVGTSQGSTCWCESLTWTLCKHFAHKVSNRSEHSHTASHSEVHKLSPPAVTQAAMRWVTAGLPSWKTHSDKTCEYKLSHNVLGDNLRINYKLCLQNCTAFAMCDSMNHGIT